MTKEDFMISKFLIWLGSKFLTQKTYKWALKLVIGMVVNNIKNDKKKDWKDTHLLPLLEPALKGVAK